MVHNTNNLRRLYRSSRKSAASNNTEKILNNLLEDLLNNLQLDRVLFLRLNQTDLSLKIEKRYGFNSSHHIPENTPFTAATGLLHQVYTDKEPLIYISPGENQFSSMASIEAMDNSKVPDPIPDRRTNIKLYISAPKISNDDFSEKMQYKHLSTVLFDGHDKDIRLLIGKSESFLILPIIDKSIFYGFIIADKFYSREIISYDEARLSCTLANHFAHALCRAREHKQMLTKISNQLVEIDHLETYYQSIMRNLRSGLLILNQLMNITEMNQAAEILLGYKEAELVNKPIDFLLEGEQEDYECLFLDSHDDLDSSMGLLTEIFMHKKNGHIFPAELCFSVITDHNDNIQGMSCIFQDITSRRALERDLARIDKLSSLGELAGGIAHEIKNPLAGIAGAIQIISKKHDQESPHGYIFNEVLHQISRLDSFVSGLLQFARPGRTNFNTVDLKNLIEKALLATESKLLDKDIKVITHFNDNPPQIEGDAQQLQTVFSNILENAIEAIDKKGIITIETYWDFNSTIASSQHDSYFNVPGCTATSGRFTVAVTDTGKGIENDFLEVIFNPFHTSKIHRTGLGLSISHRIIEQHNGIISVKSTPGYGTTFSIQLPICSRKKIILNSIITA